MLSTTLLKTSFSLSLSLFLSSPLRSEKLWLSYPRSHPQRLVVGNGFFSTPLARALPGLVTVAWTVTRTRCSLTRALPESGTVASISHRCLNRCLDLTLSG